MGASFVGVGGLVVFNKQLSTYVFKVAGVDLAWVKLSLESVFLDSSAYLLTFIRKLQNTLAIPFNYRISLSKK